MERRELWDDSPAMATALTLNDRGVELVVGGLRGAGSPAQAGCPESGNFG